MSENDEKKVDLVEEAWKEAVEKIETNQEKKEIKIPIKEGDLLDETISQLIKEKVEKDSKETVVGRKGHVDEVETKDPVGMDTIMKKLKDIEHQNRNLMGRFSKV